MKFVGITTLLLLLAACSNKQVYTAIQQNRQSECAKLPQVHFEQCMKDYGAPYEDYARERQEVLEEGQY